MGDETEADSAIDWAEQTKWAKRRFWNMRAKPGSLLTRQEKQAAKDRERYPEYQKDTVSALPMMIRFMVKVCGIPFAHAEAQAVSDYRHQEKHQTTKGIMYGYIALSIPEDAEPAHVAKWLAERDIIEAMTFARIANQARKGTEGATFWNEVVRELRTGQFAKLKPIGRAVELDEAEHRKALRARHREWVAKEKAEKAAARALQKPDST